MLKEITGEKFLQVQKQTGEPRKTVQDKQIIPIDCIKVDSYQAPQLNWLPIKLLMLQKKQKQALRITCLALKQIINMFDFTEIRDLVCFDDKVAAKINLSFMQKKDVGTEAEEFSESSTQSLSPDQKEEREFGHLKHGFVSEVDSILLN